MLSAVLAFALAASDSGLYVDPSRPGDVAAISISGDSALLLYAAAGQSEWHITQLPGYVGSSVAYGPEDYVLTGAQQFEPPTWKLSKQGDAIRADRLTYQCNVVNGPFISCAYSPERTLFLNKVAE